MGLGGGWEDKKTQPQYIDNTQELLNIHATTEQKQNTAERQGRKGDGSEAIPDETGQDESTLLQHAHAETSTASKIMSAVYIHEAPALPRLSVHVCQLSLCKPEVLHEATQLVML